MPTILPNRKARLGGLLRSEDTYATVLVTILLDMYGTDALQWSPDTIVMEFKDDFAVELPKANVDRLMAAVGILTTDDFYKRLPVFVQYCNILSGDEFSPHTFNPADPAECAWGIVEAMLLSPPDEDEPFTEEIRAYIGKALDDAGVKNAPDVLGIALRDSWEADFSGMSLQDPAMFGAEFQGAQEREQEIVATVKQNMQELIQQLSQLPLQNGRTQDLMERLQQGGWRQ